MKISFNTVRKPNRFNYIPIFYNEAKEKHKERERKVREELGLPPLEGDENISAEQKIRGKFSAARTEKSIEFSRGTKKVSNIRILIIAGILLMLIYFIYSTGLEKTVNLFTNN